MPEDIRLRLAEDILSRVDNSAKFLTIAQLVRLKEVADDCYQRALDDKDAFRIGQWKTARKTLDLEIAGRQTSLGV